MFQINSTTGRLTMTDSTQDHRSSPWCIVKITASDSGQPCRQTVHFITINTFQPSTRCSSGLPSLNISFTIEENTLPGSIVGYLSSSEYFDDDVSDLEVEADKRTYWLVSGNALATFSVDSVTGALVIAGPVDFELCSWYGLVVWILNAVGKCIGKLHVEVVVVNVNDNPPQFDADLTYITLREAMPSAAKVYTPVAYDADGSALFYAMDEGQSSVGVASWMVVDDVKGQVVTRRPLEGAPRQMHVVITATDDVRNDVRRHVTSMTLVITVVKDADDVCERGRGQGRGLVDEVTMRVSVDEDLDVGSFIAAAETSDVVKSSCVVTPTYSLESTHCYELFSVDRFTGQSVNLV